MIALVAIPIIGVPLVIISEVLIRRRQRRLHETIVSWHRKAS